MEFALLPNSDGNLYVFERRIANRKPDPIHSPSENRLTSETQTNSYLAGSYTYNADGQRVRRTVSGQPSAVTTWQVYGLGGELLAEYAANASAASPQKEYGYRNGQLLITADAPAPVTNVALATNGGVASSQKANRGQACDFAILRLTEAERQRKHY